MGTLPERIAAARRVAGLTQHALATALGINRSTVAKWETGETKPQRFLLPLARLLHVDPADLVADEPFPVVLQAHPEIIEQGTGMTMAQIHALSENAEAFREHALRELTPEERAKIEALPLREAFNEADRLRAARRPPAQPRSDG